MDYPEFEDTLHELIDQASDAVRERFARETLQQLLSTELSDEILREELDDPAAATLGLAREQAATSSAQQLREWIDEIDEGTVSDGDMDPELLFVISAIEYWANYLETGDSTAVFDLALVSIEQVDFEVSADVHDFLALPEMAEEFERIQRVLGS